MTAAVESKGSGTEGVRRCDCYPRRASGGRERQGGSERVGEGVRGSVSEGHISTLKLPVTREAKIRYV